jgi:hypothetical protein
VSNNNELWHLESTIAHLQTVGETGGEKRRFRDEIEGRDVGDVDGFESHFFFCGRGIV